MSAGLLWEWPMHRVSENAEFLPPLPRFRLIRTGRAVKLSQISAALAHDDQRH